MTTLEALKGINSYPIPLRTFQEVSERRGIVLEDEVDVQSRGYMLAKADILLWLTTAPQVTQGGQSYSFSEDQRLQMRRQANELYRNDVEDKPRYGYQGSQL